MTTRIRRSPAALAVCCTAVLVAVLATLVAVGPGAARAAPPSSGNSEIPTAPGAKPTPDSTDDPCKNTVCIGKTPPPLTPSSGTSSTPSQPKQGKKGEENEKPANYLGALTNQGKCIDSPHVTAPRNAGKVAGQCIPVDSFGAIVLSDGGATGALECAASGVLCMRNTTNQAAEASKDTSLGTLFVMVWSSYRTVVYVTAWFTMWAMSFDFYNTLAEFADTLRTTWDKRIIERSGLGGIGGLILTIAVLWAGMIMLFRNFRRGLTEMLLAILIASIAATMFLHTGVTMRKAMEGARFLGLSVAAVSADPTGTVPGSAGLAADEVAEKQVGNAVGDKYVRAILVKPHMIANTGQVQTGVCERRYWEMLGANGKAKADAAQRFAEQRDGKGDRCVPAGAMGPSVERIMAAALMLLMAVVVSLVCFICAGLLVLCQLGAAAYLATAGIVGTIAPLPKWGRPLLARWAKGLLKVLAGVVASILVVVLYLNLLGLVLGLTPSPLGSFVIAVAAAIVGWRLWKRLTRSFRNWRWRGEPRMWGQNVRTFTSHRVEREVVHREATVIFAGFPADGTAAGRGEGAMPHNFANAGAPGFASRVQDAMRATPQGQQAMHALAGNSRPALTGPVVSGVPKSDQELPSGGGSAGRGGAQAVIVASKRSETERSETEHRQTIEQTAMMTPGRPGGRGTWIATRVADRPGESCWRAVQQVVEKNKNRVRRDEETMSAAGYN